MKRVYNYVSSNTKVFYDKASDYLYQYVKSDNIDGDNSDNDLSDNDDDTIKDYDGTLTIELYEDEDKSTRIYPCVSLYTEYNSFWSEPTHVIDNIYLGSAYNAASYKTLKNRNIKVIMNATTEISDYYPNDFTYLRYKLYDNNKHSIKKYLEKSYSDIKYHQENTPGNILIHCFMGASRSASIVIYYLMRSQKKEDNTYYTFDDAISFLKDKRIVVNPTFRLTKDLAQSIMIKPGQVNPLNKPAKEGINQDKNEKDKEKEEKE
ncbi:MAG: dual specificity phosphatase [Barrevirus sp.]|uniref:Dual specificity phosphatase n=1 Tax=Barrevirus sp. TaxID=2487763 RepID=A0A3G4ZTU6_9VIRU|nr:MAG: dual specificity phosphatase [Barrevirus sp.]